MEMLRRLEASGNKAIRIPVDTPEWFGADEFTKEELMRMIDAETPSKVKH
jgi:hypothetical protein